MRLNDLRTDPKKEKVGAWVDWRGDVRLKLRRVGNDDYRRAIAEALKPHRALIRADALPAATMDRITRQAYARHILVGWENLTNVDDEPIPYSAETAEKILTDPAHHDFYAFVITQSANFENYREEEAKEDLGNSRRSSTGSGSGGRSRSNSGSTPAKGDKSTRSTGSRRSRSGSKPPGPVSVTSTTQTTA